MKPSSKTFDKICPQCGNNFQVKFKKRNQVFCSLSCNSLHRWSIKGERKIFTKPCNFCGKEMSNIPSREKDNRGKYCSKECYSKAMIGVKIGSRLSEETREKISIQRRGSLNPAFIHGQSAGAKRYKGMFSHIIKQKIRERDGNKCTNCGSDKLIDVHHIDDNPLNNEFSNLITLCRSCHMFLHRDHKFPQIRHDDGKIPIPTGVTCPRIPRSS